MEDCVFCKIVNGEIPSEKIYEDKDILAFKDSEPKAPIHILVIPKKHYKNILEVREDDDIVSKIFVAINRIAKDEGFDDEGFRVITNCGKNAGQSVMHLHFHILSGKKLGDKDL